MQQFANQKGYFLVLVLIFIHLFAIVSLHHLSRIKHAWHSAIESWQIEIDNINSEYVLRKFEKTLANDKNTCMIQQQSLP